MTTMPHKYIGRGAFTRVLVWRSKYPAPGVYRANAAIADLVKR